MNKTLLIALTIAILITIGLIFVVFFYLGDVTTPLEDLPICNEDTYNCADFSTQAEAQKIFNGCDTDIHQLDGDGNGLACEGLS